MLVHRPSEAPVFVSLFLVENRQLPSAGVPVFLAHMVMQQGSCQVTDLHKLLTERARQGLACNGDGAGIRTGLKRGLFPLALPGVVKRVWASGKGSLTFSSVSLGRSLSLSEPRFLCLWNEAHHVCRGSERML